MTTRGNFVSRSEQRSLFLRGVRRCSNCLAVKPLDQFNSRPEAPSGKRSTCKPCHAERHLRSRYGLTRAQVEEIVAEQGGCAICHVTEPDAAGWQVDHDYTTGTRRGVLCRPCNQGIGFLKDCRTTLASAIDYLEKHAGR